MQLYFELQNMAQQDLLKYIPPAVLSEIQNNHERIEAYGIAHEGESSSTIVDPATGKKSSKALLWFRNIIDKIKGSIKPGTPVFHLHNTDNSTQGRKKIGEVINTIFDQASGKVVSIIRRFADSLALSTDIASFEAPLLIQDIQGAQGLPVQPHQLGEITGIALADSRKMQPAFAGAVRETYLQCLKMEETMPEMLDLSKILAYIQEHKEITPLSIFAPEAILETETVKEALASKKGNENLYHENQRLKATLETTRAKHEEEKQELAKAMQSKDGELLLFKSKEVYQSELQKRDKLNEKQRAFIDLEKASLKIEPDKDLSQQVNGFFDAALQKYEALEKNIFSTPGENPNPGNGNPPPPGNPPTGGNPLIPA